MQHQILIASYYKDFVWLRQCLRSLEKFSTGFLPPVVAVPFENEYEARKLVEDAGSSARIQVWNGPGFGRAQCAMMHGDLLCPDANYHWLVGSDCLATGPFSPQTYCDESGLPYMLLNSWEHLVKFNRPALNWRAGVEKALGFTSHWEYMRRLPLAYPSGMLAGMREHVAALHGDFRDYVHREVNGRKNFSESNVMGEWAWRHAHDCYNWVDLDKGWPAHINPVTPIVQFWSHGGFDRPRDGMTESPRDVILRTLGSL